MNFTEYQFGKSFNTKELKEPDRYITLYVPYKEKEQAKKYGAKWNRCEKNGI